MPRNIKSKPFSEINVTPFVDVMLVLLIIFMVTAPLLTVGVQVDLPESNADSLQSDNEPLELTISKDGNIYIQETEVNIKELIPKLVAITENRLDTKIYVRGDEVSFRGTHLYGRLRSGRCYQQAWERTHKTFTNPPIVGARAFT